MATKKDKMIEGALDGLIDHIHAVQKVFKPYKDDVARIVLGGKGKPEVLLKNADFKRLFKKMEPKIDWDCGGYDWLSHELDGVIFATRVKAKRATK